MYVSTADKTEEDEPKRERERDKKRKKRVIDSYYRDYLVYHIFPSSSYNALPPIVCSVVCTE